MDVLVVGGTGLIGRSITRQAVAAGHDVTVFTRGETTAELPAAVDFQHGDRDDDGALVAARDAVDPDAVVDMVCFTPDQARSAVDVFGGAVDQYVFCSTVDVYHRPLPANPATETVPREPAVSEPAVSDYGADKAAAEDVFLAADADDAFGATVIRPWSTYGEGGPVLHTFGVGTYYLDRIRRGEPIVVHGDGQGLWGPCHRDDVAAAFVAALGNERTYGEDYHVTSEAVITWNQYHRTVARAMDAPEPDLVHVPTDCLLDALPERTAMLDAHFQYSTVFDTTKARRDLDFAQTVDFETGIERTIDRLEREDRIDSWDSENDDAVVAAWRTGREAFLDAFDG